MIHSKQRDTSTKITTALLLAAGTGTRLQPMTLDAPKCLTEVGGISILGRLINNLRAQGFVRLIVVLGHLGDCIKEFLQQYADDMQVDYVINPDYRTTNNIYSLWLARRQIHAPFLLVESDLVFEKRMLNNMLQPDRMAISRMLPWMNGTTVELGMDEQISAFHMGANSPIDARQYKTVNLYSLSLSSWRQMERRLSRYIAQGKLNDYYEIVFAELVAEGKLYFGAVFFDADRWYEIDTCADLHEAEKLFDSPLPLARRPLIDIDPVTNLA